MGDGTPILKRDFFQSDPLTCARELIGCVVRWNGCSGLIVETEAYAALNDEACHTWSRPSAREFVASHSAGDAYVYFNYGMYWMLNVLVKGGSEDGFVLFRAIEPMSGIDAMRRLREASRRTRQRPMKDTELCSGPGKLAQALAVTGADHGRDFCKSPGIGLFQRPNPVKVVSDVRVGISKATELKWRFLLAGSPHVSRPAATRPARYSGASKGTQTCSPHAAGPTKSPS